MPLVRYLVEQIRHFCKKPPKGFEKYFEEGKPGAKPASAAKDGETSEKPKSSAKSPQQQQQSKSDWNLGMFSNTSKQEGNRGGNQGRSAGDGSDGNREKMLIFGGITAVAVLASFAYFEMGYKEISWKEFVTK